MKPRHQTPNQPGSTRKREGVRGDSEKEGHSPKCSNKIAMVTSEDQLGLGPQVQFDPENMSKRQE